jgi:hypothetical protein
MQLKSNVNKPSYRFTLQTTDVEKIGNQMTLQWGLPILFVTKISVCMFYLMFVKVVISRNIADVQGMVLQLEIANFLD